MKNKYIKTIIFISSFLLLIFFIIKGITLLKILTSPYILDKTMYSYEGFNKAIQKYVPNKKDLIDNEEDYLKLINYINNEKITELLIDNNGMLLIKNNKNEVYSTGDILIEKDRSIKSIFSKYGLETAGLEDNSENSIFNKGIFLGKSSIINQRGVIYGYLYYEGDKPIINYNSHIKIHYVKPNWLIYDIRLEDNNY